jgi:hypothetical protein
VLLASIDTEPEGAGSSAAERCKKRVCDECFRVAPREIWARSLAAQAHAEDGAELFLKNATGLTRGHIRTVGLAPCVCCPSGSEMQSMDSVNVKWWSAAACKSAATARTEVNSATLALDGGKEICDLMRGPAGFTHERLHCICVGHLRDFGLQHDGLRALSCMMQDSAANQAEVVGAGGLQVTMAAMRQHRGSAELLRNGCEVLLQATDLSISSEVSIASSVKAAGAAAKRAIAAGGVSLLM